MPYYGPASAGTAATTVTDETIPAVASAVGVSTNYARQDHTHGTEAFAMAAQILTATTTVTGGYFAWTAEFVEVPVDMILEIGVDAYLEVLV